MTDIMLPWLAEGQITDLVLYLSGKSYIISDSTRRDCLHIHFVIVDTLCALLTRFFFQTGVSYNNYISYKAFIYHKIVIT